MYTLIPSGQFVQEVRMNMDGPISSVTLWEEAYKGSCRVSGGTFTLNYQSAEHKEAGKQWEPINLPVSRTLTFTLGEDEYWGGYFDAANGGLPPFNEPVTRLPNQTSEDDCILTRFVKTDHNSSALGR